MRHCVALRFPSMESIWKLSDSSRLFSFYPWMLWWKKSETDRERERKKETQVGEREGKKRTESLFFWRTQKSSSLIILTMTVINIVSKQSVISRSNSLVGEVFYCTSIDLNCLVSVLVNTHSKALVGILFFSCLIQSINRCLLKRRYTLIPTFLILSKDR